MSRKRKIARTLNHLTGGTLVSLWKTCQPRSTRSWGPWTGRMIVLCNSLAKRICWILLGLTILASLRGCGKVSPGQRDQLSPLWVCRRSEDIINLTVVETNKYAASLLSHPSLPANSRIRRWVPITAQDLWTFFGIIMLQSIIPIPVEKDYWTPNLPYLKVGNFPDIMPFYRFRLIKRCLHFVDNVLYASGTPSKLLKIQPVIDLLNSKFSSLYLPGQKIAIDESLLLWKGRLSFSQLIATKAAQVGIKSYELCESKSGYLWQMIIYTGKKAHDEQHNVVAIDTDEAEPEPDSATSRAVLQLVRPLLNRGHTLVMDNFYNSPLLTRILKAQRTDVMGTLRLNREFVPHSLRTKNKLAMRSGEVGFSPVDTGHDDCHVEGHECGIAHFDVPQRRGRGGKEK